MSETRMCIACGIVKSIDEFRDRYSCKECERKRNKRRYEERKNNPENIARRLIGFAKRRAAKFGIEFNLLPEDIFVPFECPVLGIQLRVGDDSTDDSPTLDRILPSKGYIRGNILVVSMLANRIKTNANPKQIKRVAEFYERLISNGT